MATNPGTAINSCTDCDAGYYCPLGTANPIICPAGHYCSTGSSFPTKCPKGTFRALTGATVVADCVDCSPGFFCSMTGLLAPNG